MPPLEIRPAAQDDLPAILDLIRQLAEYERLSTAVVATQDVLRDSLFGIAPAAEVILAFVEGQPAGFAVFFENFSTFVGRRGLYLEDLFVVPDRRRHGIGRALLQHLAGIAVQRQCGRFEWTVLDWNAPAIAFYKSLGAVPMDEWTTFRLSGDALTALAQQAR